MENAPDAKIRQCLSVNKSNNWTKARAQTHTHNYSRLTEGASAVKVNRPTLSLDILKHPKLKGWGGGGGEGLFFTFFFSYVNSNGEIGLGKPAVTEFRYPACPAQQ